MRTPQDERSKGTAYAFTAYGMWGLFPLYFASLHPSGPWEILAHRIVWTALFCLVVLAIRRDLGWIRGLLRDTGLTLRIVVAALVVAANWGVYVYAVLIGRATDASLGYFLNPLVTVALGVLVLRERLRPAQWAAVGIGALAAAYLTVDAGQLPWISLALAFSFAIYGLIKKQVGGRLTAMRSLAAETFVLAPLALIAIGVLAHRGETTFGRHGATHAWLLWLSGIVTAVPLLLFAAAARRIPLVSIGLIQFVAPVLQLLVAVTALHEHMSGARWVGFAIVWVALVVLSVDSLLLMRTRRT